MSQLMANPLVLVGIFVACTFVGYKLINNVPSLLHTPLMSGMNALSGIAVLGAIVAASVVTSGFIRVLMYIALSIAMVNVAGGFGVTNRMLKMFKPKKK